MRLDHFASAYRRVWESFLTATQTTDGRHDTPRWHAHEGPFAACVIRIREPDLQPALSLLDERLASLQGVRVHPPHFLHVMLQELGFVVDKPSRPEEISASRLEDFLNAAIDPVSAIAPFSVTIGGANAFEDAVFLEIGNGAGIAHLHGRLLELAALQGTPEYPYLPHCTIAHFDGTCPPHLAIQAIEPWRAVGFGRFQVGEIEVVAIDPKQAYPELETVAVIPFGA